MARGRKSPLVITLSYEERKELEKWQRSTTVDAGLARRGRIILLLSQGMSLSDIARRVGIQRCVVRKWVKRFLRKRVKGLYDKPGRGAKPFFPPEVVIRLVKLACERPDSIGRSLSQWDCQELARQLVEEGVVESISPETVRRILTHHQLKPWRHHMWLTSKQPRDEEFYARVQELIDLYTRPLLLQEVVLCVDEKTSLQPRPRLHPTRPAIPGKPNRVEHEYKRDGAINLFAAFDTRSGRVYGQCHGRKRQVEFIGFLEHLNREIPAKVTTIHLVCDNVSVHHGKKVRQWLATHPRFQMHFTPVHCSWMNQVEQWFSILQRKRFRIADFASKLHLQERIERFIHEWNQVAHPFNWSTKSAAKIMAEVPFEMAA
jgi:transposase